MYQNFQIPVSVIIFVKQCNINCKHSHEASKVILLEIIQIAGLHNQGPLIFSHISSFLVKIIIDLRFQYLAEYKFLKPILDPFCFPAGKSGSDYTLAETEQNVTIINKNCHIE